MEHKMVYTTADVLIVGGGIAGLMAANKIKEREPDLDVLVAERATSGTAGKANKGAGILMYVPEDVDLDDYTEYVASTLGGYLTDQKLIPKYAAATREVLSDFERWGVKFARDPEWDNELVTFSIDAGERWSLCMIEHDSTEILAKRAKKLGVRFIDKLQIVDLLTAKDAVIGAMGFDSITGECHVLSAKSTVLATGSCDYMYAHMWKNARGDGIAAAYRAGAELRGCEFSNFYNMAIEGNYSCVVGPGCMFCYLNDKGQPIGPKYATRDEPDFSAQFYYGVEKEVANGFGPVRLIPENFLELPGNDMRPLQREFEAHSHGKEVQYNRDHDHNPVVIPYFLGEMSPVRTDHDMRTTLSGLWSVGDTCYTGSGLAGALSTPARMRGSGLMFAAASAALAAPSVAETTKSAALCSPDAAEVDRLRERMYAPLDRNGGKNPREVIYDLQCVVAPPYYSISKTDAKLAEALSLVEKCREDAEHTTAGGDYHMLGLCHDAVNMSHLAKLYFEAARARTESRGFHYRQDYPFMDNLHWLKWSVTKRVGNEDVLSHEDVPIDDYDTQPMF